MKRKQLGGLVQSNSKNSVCSYSWFGVSVIAAGIREQIWGDETEHAFKMGEA